MTSNQNNFRIELYIFAHFRFSFFQIHKYKYKTFAHMKYTCTVNLQRKITTFWFFGWKVHTSHMIFFFKQFIRATKNVLDETTRFLWLLWLTLKTWKYFWKKFPFSKIVFGESKMLMDFTYFCVLCTLANFGLKYQWESKIDWQFLQIEESMKKTSKKKFRLITHFRVKNCTLDCPLFVFLLTSRHWWLIISND